MFGDFIICYISFLEHVELTPTFDFLRNNMITLNQVKTITITKTQNTQKLSKNRELTTYPMYVLINILDK